MADIKAQKKKQPAAEEEDSSDEKTAPPLPNDKNVVELEATDNEILALLALACFRENYDAAKSCIDDDNAELVLTDPVDGDRRTVLHYCVQNRSTRLAALVIERHEGVINAADANGHTPLLLSVIAGNLPMTEHLLQTGADIHRSDNNQHSVAHWAVASQYKDIETFRRFIDLFARYDGDLSSRDSERATPLHYAAQSTDKNADDMIECLIDKKVDVDCRDIYERTPLIWAATTGSEVGCRSLLKAGADVNAKDTDGITALHCASSWGHVKCIEILTKDGAVIDSQDINGCTPLFYSVIHRQPDSTRLLIRRKANTNHQDNKGRSVTHCAAAIGSTECLEILRSNQTDMWLQSKKKGHYPIHEAALQSHTGCVKYLLEKCSKDRKKDIDVGNTNGRTCLHIGAMTGNFALVDYLVKNGADKNAVTVSKERQMTPYDSALAKRQLQGADYLLRHGAKSAEQLQDEEDERKRKDEEAAEEKEEEDGGKDAEKDESETEKEEKEKKDKKKKKKGGSAVDGELGQAAAVAFLVPGIKLTSAEETKEEEEKKAVEEKKLQEEQTKKASKRSKAEKKRANDDAKETEKPEGKDDAFDDWFDATTTGGSKAKKNDAAKNDKDSKKTDVNEKQQLANESQDGKGKAKAPGKGKQTNGADVGTGRGGEKKETPNNDETKGRDAKTKKADKEKNRTMTKDKISSDEDMKRKKNKTDGRREQPTGEKASTQRPRQAVYHRPPATKKLFKPYFSLIQEQVRVFETKRLASLKMKKSRQFEYQGNEKAIVRRLARDFNEDARPEDRIPSGQFSKIRDFQRYLQGEYIEADEWEKRLKKIEKVNPLYDSRPGHRQAIDRSPETRTQRARLVPPPAGRNQPQQRDTAGGGAGKRGGGTKTDDSDRRHRRTADDEDEASSNDDSARYDDDYDSSDNDNTSNNNGNHGNAVVTSNGFVRVTRPSVGDGMSEGEQQRSRRFRRPEP